MLHGLDLFSGIGGLTKALDGYVRPVAYCEIEPYARAVLLSRMHSGDLPLAPIWDDVLTLHGTMLPQVDIIYGGFPCQDISVAGRQKGLAGERSGLFSEICRLAKETEAEWLFLENVPNIRTKGLGTVLQTLAEIGYDTRYGMLSASDVGANHKRERWFLLARTKSKQNRWICESGIQSNTGTGGELVTNTVCKGLEGQRQKSSGITPQLNNISDIRWWEVEPNVGRVANGIPKRVDRLRALGNAVVPQCAREAFERLIGLK